MTNIKQNDLIQSIADAFQFISYYHPKDFISALGKAYEMEQGEAAKDAIAQILTNSRMCAEGHRPMCQDTGIAVVFPDTSPRGDGVFDDAAYDLGQGAGFYVNATQTPWAPHFRMWDYVTEELPRLLFSAFPLAEAAQAITGHSMGGHGALTIAMSFPGRFRSVSAFAPICHPSASAWGRKQFTAYLGADEAAWASHDATLLMRKRGFDGPMLIDQGSSDQFLDLLKPEALAQAMAETRQSGAFRMQKGYDHSYFFVSTFIEEHVAFHVGALHG